MKSIEVSSIYATQISHLMRENGLDENFGAKVKKCSNLNEIFQVLSDRSAQHVALLTESGHPIEDMFGYIKVQLAEKKTVALALFFDKEEKITTIA